MKYKEQSDIDIDIVYVSPGPGIVPVFETMEAANAGGYTWSEYERLSYHKKLECVAWFRMHNKVDRVVQNEITIYHKSHKVGR